MELLGGKPAGGERRHQRTGAGHRLDPQAGGADRGHDPLAWIADPGRPRVGNQSHRPTVPKAFDDVPRTAGLVEVEARDQRLLDPEMLQETSRAPGILRSDHIAGPEHPERPERDVLEVPDRRRDEVQRPGHEGCRLRRGLRRHGRERA